MLSRRELYGPLGSPESRGAPRTLDVNVALQFPDAVPLDPFELFVEEPARTVQRSVPHACIAFSFDRRFNEPQPLTGVTNAVPGPFVSETKVPASEVMLVSKIDGPLDYPRKMAHVGNQAAIEGH